MLGFMVGSQESHIVDLCPAALLIAQEMGVTPQEALESLKSSRCHDVRVTVADHSRNVRGVLDNRSGAITKFGGIATDTAAFAGRTAIM